MKDTYKTKKQLIEEIESLRKIEEKLRESEERYRSFVQNFKGIAYRGRMDFMPIFFHGVVEEITGYTEEDFRDGTLRWDHIIHPEDLPKIYEDAIKTIPHYSTEREYRIIRKDGQTRWVLEFMQNICDDSGKPIFVQGTIYDITERKKAEEEFRNTKDCLLYTSPSPRD